VILHLSAYKYTGEVSHSKLQNVLERWQTYFSMWFTTAGYTSRWQVLFHSGRCKRNGTSDTRLRLSLHYKSITKARDRHIILLFCNFLQNKDNNTHRMCKRKQL